MRFTIAVCTHDRPDHLRRCLQSLLPQLAPRDEILVVDSAPTTNQTHTIVSSLPARYIYEARPGLDVARNTAVNAAQGDIIAFVDDDVIMANGWLNAMRRAFKDDSTAFVTGRTLPQLQESPAQRYFELRFSFDRGEQPQRFTPSDDRPWYPIHPYHLGAGCNMAFRRALFTRVGLFDEALDAGTPSGGGGDLDMFRRALLAGLEAVYAPDALAYHAHRADVRANQRQFWNYGKTFGALMTKISLDEHGLRRQIPRLIGQQAAMLLKLAQGRLRRRHELPVRLILLEGIGNLAGLPAYLWAVRQARARRLIYMLPSAIAEEKMGQKSVSLSLIVCTRDRPDPLNRCLNSIGRLADKPGELIVVDNGRYEPVNDPLIAELGGRLVHESLPGLCRARNRGLSIANGDIVAFVDDDVILDEVWLEKIMAPYTETAVQAVAGLVLPQSQATDAQQIFEKGMGGLGRGRKRKRFQGRAAIPLAPQIGVGANMSFRRRALLALGGFNEALDPGVPSQAGGDIDAFYRLLRAGGIIIYEPAARVWHEHRSEMIQLKALARAYGTGTAAAYASWMFDGDWRAARMLAALYGRYFPAQWRAARAGRTPLPSSLVWDMFKGALTGPFQYWRASRRVRRFPSILANSCHALPHEISVNQTKEAIIGR